MPSVLQNWVSDLPFMQQSVLLGAIRGPDGQAKYDPPKMLLRWYRRCVLISALDGEVLKTPIDQRGGSFTGPSLDEVEYWGKDWSVAMNSIHVAEYIRGLDAIPSHFANHFREAIQIVGYQHPEQHIAEFWENVYFRLVREMNLNPETKKQMESRLCDNRDAWIKSSDEATQL